MSDALDRLGLTGVLTGVQSLSCWPPRRLAGRVVTVELGPVATAPTSAPAPSPRHLGTAAIEAAAPGDVIVVAHQGKTDCAGWGGILSLAAQLRGVAGVIVDGACRDLDEARELDFPLFGRAGVPLTARARAVERSWGESVTVGDGLVVRTGDAVLADGSGVVFVAARDIEAVLAAAEEIFAREAAMARSIRDGAQPSVIMGRSYEELLHG
ncbi:MAG: RraA family protein [Acidimicrobiales bacterium]